MKIAELNKRNNLLDTNLEHIELTKVEIEQELEETVERLKIMEEKNLELHTIFLRQIVKERNYKVPFVWKEKL